MSLVVCLKKEPLSSPLKLSSYPKPVAKMYALSHVNLDLGHVADVSGRKHRGS